MIRIFEGVPGSGKTYAMVYYLRKWADWDNFYHEWIVREDVLIISNIDGLKIPHVNFDNLLSEVGGLSNVFSEAFVKALWDKGYKHIIFAIDEAQKYFDRKFYDKQVFYFFQYHRHYGVDILLSTQDASTLCKEIRVLAEFLIRAEQRSLTFKSFKYKFYTPDDKTHLFNKTIPKDTKVFAMYKSFDIEEADKPPNVILRHLVIPVFVFFLFIFGIVAYIKLYMFPSAGNIEDEKADIPVSSTPPVSQSSTPASPISPSLYRYSYTLLGYMRLSDGYYYYFTDSGVFRTRAPCSDEGSYLICLQPLDFYSDASEFDKVKGYKSHSPPLPSSPAPHNKPGSGLVKYMNKSHANASVFPQR